MLNKNFVGIGICMLILLVIFSCGCMESVKKEGGNQNVIIADEITALEGKNVAEKKAKAWHSDALLGFVNGDEGVKGDSNVGDGYSKYWTYTYGSPDAQETVNITVYADGHSVGPEYSSLIPSFAVDWFNWSVDSNYACDVANYHNGSIVLQEHPHVIISYRLFNEGGHQLLWDIRYTEDEDLLLRVLVNAETGDFVWSQP
jgi:hypothetical protein